MQELFTRERPVYTKVRDDMPAIYGLGSTVKNSLVADGCSIDGEVENCILFRGVQIGKGAVCVILSSCRALTSARAFISTASLPIRA